MSLLPQPHSPVQQQVDGLTKRKAELQAEDQRPQLGPQDQRAALLAQIKADNEACEVAAQRVKQATEAVRQLERQTNAAQPARCTWVLTMAQPVGAFMQTQIGCQALPVRHDLDIACSFGFCTTENGDSAIAWVYKVVVC